MVNEGSLMQPPSARRRFSKALISSLAFALTACGPPPAPPAPPAPVVEAPPAAVTATARTLAGFSLVRRPPAAPICAAPPSTEPGPISAGFREVTLPAKTPALLDVEGRDDRDVWFLPRGTDGHPSLLHWDGATLSEDRIPCYSGKGERLVLGQDTLLFLGVYDNGEYPEYQEARRSPRGAWSCPDNDGKAVYLPLGAEMLRFSGRPVLSGQDLPIPDFGTTWSALGSLDLAGHAPDDVWLSGGGDVLHWNGVTWEDMSPGLPSLWSLHVALDGTVWIAGRKGEDGSKDDHQDKKGGEKPLEEDVVLRWDPAARAWICLPTPATLDILYVRGVSANDVWLLGKKEIFHWDGKAFQRELTPIPHLSDAWLSPAGELWLVGWKDTESSSTGVGLAFRTRAEGKP